LFSFSAVVLTGSRYTTRAVFLLAYDSIMITSAERVRDPISDAELTRRWSAARERMRAREIDALVIGGSASHAAGYFRWFTGRPSEGGNPRTVIFPAEGAMTVFEHGPVGGESRVDPQDPAYRGIGRRLTTPSHIWSVSYTGGYDAELVARELKKAKHRRVALVGAAGMYHGFCAKLRELLAGAALDDVTDDIDRIKAVKSAEEIALIRRTAAMQDDIVASLRDVIRPGLTDFEVSAHAEYLGRLFGSDDGIFLGASAPPGRAALFVPRSLQGRVLCAGDSYTLLVENTGPGGYYTEIARTFVLGKASQEQKEGLAIVVEARANILRRMKSGVPCRDIWEAHNEFMRARGLPEEKRLNCHSQGYDLVERPLMRFDETLSVAESMNFACHPGFLTESNFAVICDNYLLAAGGAIERLHSTPEEIVEL
jgi:Xaa-Pro aminopeptidase